MASNNVQKSLKSSIVWSAVERFSSQAIQFVVSIIIARLLLPSDYGLIAMTAIFIGISQTFVDCGFSTALVRLQNRTEKDNSTVFYFNIVVGLFLYFILWITAPLIAKFYELDVLIPVIRIISLSVVFSSFQVVPRAVLTSLADFRTQTYASLPATLLSGIAGIMMAYQGYGVWALVWQQLISGFINTILLWFFAKWYPRLIFSFVSLHNMFEFSSKLLLSGLIDTVWNNSYTLVIGKLFTPKELGLYSRAYTLGYFPSINIAGILQRGFFPILCRYQSEEDILVKRYREFLKMSVFIVTPLMFGLAALAKPLIIILLTSKWLSSAIFLQILCFYFVLKPIVSINNNIYQVIGRSDMFLKLEIYKKTISIIFLFGGVPFGVIGMCIGNVIAELLSTIVNMHMASRVLPLSISTQIKDILPSFIVSIIMFFIIIICTSLFENNGVKILVGFIIGVGVYFFISRWIQFEEMDKFLLLLKNKV